MALRDLERTEAWLEGRVTDAPLQMQAVKVRGRR
jgi:hypothetical protein